MTTKSFKLVKTQREMEVMRLHAVWEHEEGKAQSVDLSKYENLELFYDVAPAAREVDKGGLEYEAIREAKRKLTGSNTTKSKGEWRWVLRDDKRKVAEKYALAESEVVQKEAEEAHLLKLGASKKFDKEEFFTFGAGSKLRIHDVKMEALRGIPGGAGLQLIGKTHQQKPLESVQQASSSARLPSSSLRARHVVMMQTGPNEVSVASVRSFSSFKAPPIHASSYMVQSPSSLSLSPFSSSASYRRPHHSSKSQSNLLQKIKEKEDIKEKEEAIQEALKVRGTGSMVGSRSKKMLQENQKSQSSIGADDDKFNMTIDNAQAGFGRSDVLDIRMMGGKEAENVGYDDDAVRSDDEGVRDGLDDIGMHNGHELDISDDDGVESDDEISDEDLNDEEREQKRDKTIRDSREELEKLKKQLLKGRATASVTEEGDSEDEDMEENEEGRSLGSHKEGKKSSHVVPRPHVPVPSFETLKRKRDDDISNGNNQEASKKTRSENGFVTEAEIRDALEAAGGSMKQKDFTRRFKKRIKISKAHKERFMAVIRNVVVQNDDPVRGPVYVLKEVWHS